MQTKTVHIAGEEIEGSQTCARCGVPLPPFAFGTWAEGKFIVSERVPKGAETREHLSARDYDARDENERICTLEQ